MASLTSRAEASDLPAAVDPAPRPAPAIARTNATPSRWRTRATNSAVARAVVRR